MKKLWIFAIVMVLVFAACTGKEEQVRDEPSVVNENESARENAIENVETNETNETNQTETNETNETSEANETNETNESNETNETNETSETNETAENIPATQVVIPARPADVAYSLSTDEEFQHMPVGTRGGSDDVLITPYLIGAGNPTFNVVQNPNGGVALRLTHREQTWHAVDIVAPEIGLDTSANSYRLTIRGNISEGGNVTVGGGDSPYATIFTHASSAGDFELTGTITATVLENAGERGHLRVGVNNLGNLEIHEIEFARIELVAPVVVPARPANVLWSLATDEYLQNRAQGDSGAGGAILAGTPYLQDAGSPQFTIVANPKGSGNALRVSNRADDWHTIDVMTSNMDGFNPAANTYTIRFSGKIVNPPEGSTADIMGTDNPWGRFAAVDVSGDGEFTVVANNINAEAMAERGSTNRVRIAASNDAKLSDFYIYELEVTRN
jgi:hypothetical protein